MCGLIVLDGPVPADLLEAAVAGAARRGPHCWGWATATGDVWRHVAGHGPISPPEDTDRLRLGHSRLATSGSDPGGLPPLSEAQPLVAGRFALAHNGNVTKLPTSHPVDSWALLEAVEDSGRLEVADLLAAASEGPHAAILADAGGEVVLARAAGPHRVAHPLFLASGRGWFLASSSSIPGGVMIETGKDVRCTSATMTAP